MTTSYLFQLSPLELHWLAAAFKITRLPLLDNPLRHTSNSQLAARLKDGLASLESRGLVRREASGLQVNELAVATVQWLGSSTCMLALDFYDRNEDVQHSQIFTRDGSIMYVMLEGDQYQFIFLPDREAVTDYLLEKLGGSFPDLKPARAKYTVSQPVTILPAAWTNIALATNILKVTGLSSREIKPFLAWAESLEWIVAFNSVKFEGENAIRGESTFLCGSKQSSWFGSAVVNAEDQITFVPIGTEDIRDLIKNLV